jgi:hypothetical protein
LPAPEPPPMRNATMSELNWTTDVIKNDNW